MLLQIVERKIEGDIEVVEVAGKLALGRESQKIETIFEKLAQQGARKVILNMTALDYIDSAGIGLMALAAGKLKQSGGRFAIVAPEGRVLHLLKMTQITAIVTVLSTLAEAVAAVSDSKPATA